MNLPTRRQGLAKVIFNRVKELDESAGHRHKDAYAGYAVELPSLIRNNGLAQTLAFLEHKAGSDDRDRDRAAGARDLRTDLCKILRYAANRRPAVLGTQRRDDSLDGNPDAFDYLVASRRALEASEYFKRFAESVLDADRSQPGVQS